MLRSLMTRVWLLPAVLLFSGCAINRLAEHQLICARFEAGYLTRLEAIKQLGLPEPKTDEERQELDGGIAGWLSYCRVLKR